MAKDNSNANGDGSSLDVHLVLNGKGGVGKSVVATWLAEFLVSRGRSVRCIDGDPVNRSFSQYKALPTARGLRWLVDQNFKGRQERNLPRRA
jgi:CO dehydrogenase nickel-insertion accessory protein CooC1